MITREELERIVIQKINKVMYSDEWLLINYGSNHEIYDETTDFDCCVYAEKLTYDQQLKIAHVFEQVHYQYNLKFDTDMKYINKTSFQYEDVELLRNKCHFPSINVLICLSQVNFERSFLDSHGMKMRLLLNIFTKNSTLIYGDKKRYYNLVEEIYLIFVKILMRTSNEGISIKEALKKIFLSESKGGGYKSYLGYNQNDKFQKQYIEKNLLCAFEKAEKNGIADKFEEFYFFKKEKKESYSSIVYITGASGSGTTSLGKMIAKKHDVNLIESDDLTMYDTDPPFKYPRPMDVRIKLLKKRLSREKLNIIVGSINDWGIEIINDASLFVFLYEKWSIRKERLVCRERKRFGNELYNNLEILHNFNRLLEWTKQYDDFDEPRSLKKHMELYNDFKGAKFSFMKGETTQEIYDSIKEVLTNLMDKGE